MEQKLGKFSGNESKSVNSVFNTNLNTNKNEGKCSVVLITIWSWTCIFHRFIIGLRNSSIILSTTTILGNYRTSLGSISFGWMRTRTRTSTSRAATWFRTFTFLLWRRRTRFRASAWTWRPTTRAAWTRIRSMMRTGTTVSNKVNALTAVT